MRVCLISADVPTRIGGVETFVNELSNFLSNNGADVTVIGRDFRDYVRKIDRKKIIGIRLKDYLPKILRFSHYSDYIYQLEVLRRISNKHFDIIHGGNDNSFFLLLLSGRKAPLVVTFHGTLAGASSQASRPLKPYQYFFSTYSERIVAKKCDVPIACSQAVKNELVNFYAVSPSKIEVIYNGVNTDRFKLLDKTKTRKKLRLPLKNKYVIWVGTDPKRKGLSIAMEAVRRLSGVKLLVVGVGGITDEKVVYFGRVSEAMKLLLYNAADFFIFPTFYEGFALTPLEALACGLPIIISKECTAKEIIQEGVHGFVVNERKPEGYAEKIETLLSDAKRYRDISANCRKLAERYSWENQGKKYLEIYRKLL